MSRLIDYDPESARLLIQFPFNRRLVELVRALPGRRWESRSKVWTVPVKHISHVCKQLSIYDFEVTGAVTSLLAEAGVTLDTLFQEQPVAPPQAPPVAKVRAVHTRAQNNLERGRALNERWSAVVETLGLNTPTKPKPTPKGLRVSELNAQVQHVIRRGFPEEVWVVGEISGIDRSRGRRHRFFELIEKPSHDDDVGVIARAPAVIWSRNLPEIMARLSAAPEPFELADGQQVRLKVALDFYPTGGRFQLVVVDIDPVFTLGQLALRREEILREIDRLGLRFANRSVPMPELPLRVALLTSATGEAARDFLHELERSGFAFDVDLYAIRVQGTRLARTVRAALARVREAGLNGDPYDVVAIVRGGGSRTDLAWFDNMDVALAVARMPVKVLVGIGHHRDQSVLDEIAHSEKTPTAAGKALVQQVERTLDTIEDTWATLSNAALEQLTRARTQTMAIAEDVSRSLQRELSIQHLEIKALEGRFGPIIRQRLRRVDDQLHFIGRRLRGASQHATQHARHELDQQLDSLQRRRLQTPLQQGRSELEQLHTRLRRALNHRLQDAQRSLDALELRRRLLDPAQMIRRGYARLRTADGRVITAASNVHIGDSVEIELRDGRLHAQINARTLNSTQPPSGQEGVVEDGVDLIPMNRHFSEDTHDDE